MAQKAPLQTSSKMRIGVYEEAQREILIKLKQKEKELKTLLAELQATRNLLIEAEHDREEEEELESNKKEEETLDKEIENLEEITKKVTNELATHNETPYQAISQQELAMATGYDARKDLYNLLYKNKWNTDDAKKFFTITQAHQVANEYDFNPLVRENLNQTYNVIQQVVERQQEQIKATYQPTMTKPSDFNLENTLAGVNMPAKTKSTTDKLYKPSEKKAYTPTTPKILDILKKK